jgi:dephospho-CoA kinase
MTMILGITGGMGCGKSTAARGFERHGFQCLDSDALVREKVLTLPAVRDQLRARYGDGMFERDGPVDRARLAERVFGDDRERAWLEDLTHPPLLGIWRQAFQGAPAGRWAVEVPLLFEKNLENWFDFTICVACAPAQQLARLEQRGLPHALAEQRISKQLPLARKIELADFVLWNEGSAQFLQDQVNELVPALRTVS